MQKYLPCYEATDDCADATCSCGTQGRVTMNNARSGMLPGFGLHIVEARGRHSTREAADGGVTVEQIEDIFTARIDGWANYSTDVNAQAWADHHTAMWAYDGLDSYLATFKKDKVAFQLGTWKSPTGTPLWSILVQNPDTQLILDLQGNCTTCADESEYYSWPESRGVATRINSKYAGEHVLASVHISRSVSDVSEITQFYKLAFGVDPAESQTLDDGTKIVDIDVVSGGTRLRFVERGGQGGTHTTAWFQDHMVNASKVFMTSSNSCWPVWGDNHWGGSNGEDLSGIVATFKENGLPYHLFSSASWGNKLHGYFYEPSGWQIQLNDDYAKPPSQVEEWSGSLCFTSCE